ncbi:c-type cytochrome [Flavihumibacter stibioxidans]|uniref:Quinol:cytochrome C oxidoreductase n=1 Tax=Flavihumibacter stibioxidans TaxID=1834163 RepID=A0ABR7MAW6_9BACT|nr:cytochrome c [Flavihumibacter stibioxidans]MBC6491984.1 quinol:cytochrome C oxidoreductase [Flavihumibacter stibioxidans]
MNKISIIAVCIGALAVTACSSDVKRTPGKIYMPDMAYSRAVETYSDPRELQAEGINYNARPVAGTVARGEEVIYKQPADTTGGYMASAALKNPLPLLNEVDSKEAERLYLINCGICHGTKLDGNGPLYKGGDGPFPAKPATLVGDPLYAAMAEGTMFYSITYGRNLMGPHASQLSPKQRWMVVHYIKAKQREASGESAPVAAEAAPAADSTAK